MPHNQTQLDTIIDTIYVYNRCFEGENCPNHPHGILDSTFYLQANIGTGKSYRKVMPNEVDKSVNCDNLYIDVFGHLFYLEPEIKQTKDAIMEIPKLTSFDSIKVGDKVFPAASAFVPHYFTHTESVHNISNNTEMLFDISCYSILVWATIGYVIRSFVRNSWGKLWKDIISA
jgi:hypothetical protein